MSYPKPDDVIEPFQLVAYEIQGLREFCAEAASERDGLRARVGELEERHCEWSDPDDLGDGCMLRRDREVEALRASRKELRRKLVGMRDSRDHWKAVAGERGRERDEMADEADRWQRRARKWERIAGGLAVTDSEGLPIEVGQFLYGYLAAYGGRRSDLGRHDAGQVLGLRRYVKKLPKEDIGRFLKNDPDYYFNYAPYALAMGVINPYSRSFGQRKLEPCPYLMVGVTGKHTAEEWGHMLADVADMMDHRARRMQIEKWFAVKIQVKPQEKRRSRRR